MGMIHCPYCDRMVENPEIMEVASLTSKQVDLLWQIKELAYKLYGEAYTHPHAQKMVRRMTGDINSFLEDCGEDPTAHIVHIYAERRNYND